MWVSRRIEKFFCAKRAVKARKSGRAKTKTVPPENSVQPTVEVIPRNNPQRSSGLRLCLNLVNQFAETQQCASTVRTRKFKRQKPAPRPGPFLALFSQPVVRGCPLL